MNSSSPDTETDAIAGSGAATPEALYEAWTAAMESRDIDRVLALYEKDEAVLWGTLAVELKKGHENIRNYFDTFLDRCSLAIDTRTLELRTAGPGVVIANGAYEFALGGASASDPVKSVMARFSFVFREQADSGSWRILDHHSSQFPEARMKASDKRGR